MPYQWKNMNLCRRETSIKTPPNTAIHALLGPSRRRQMSKLADRRFKENQHTADHTVDGQIQWTVGSVGSIGFLADFEFYMAVLGVPSGPTGLVAPLGFKILDSQPEKSNMGPIPIDVHDFLLFQKSRHGFPARYLSCFRPNRPKVGFFMWPFMYGLLPQSATQSQQ